ncbi:MAG: rRNA maturation RNase YbeY [Leptolyngbyaceae cyanobacterium]
MEHPIQVEMCLQNGFLETETPANSEFSHSPASQPELPQLPEEVQWQEWFQRWLEVLNPDLSPIHSYELSLRLTDDREIQALNARYRHQDKPTDVLAFAALEDTHPQADEVPSSLPLYLGDIVISLDTAQKQAQTQGHSLQTELVWLASHGLLHLLGWDHPDDDSLMQMLDKQQFLLHTVGLSTPDR